MDKVTLKFLADVLYIKGVFCIEELEDVMNACNPSDLDVIIDKMLDDKYYPKRGETYGFGNVVSRSEYSEFYGNDGE